MNIDAEAMFNLVWRKDRESPGFAFMDLEIGSRDLRKLMVSLRDKFNEIAASHGLNPFHFFNVTRFNQKTTSKFHLDGGPQEAILVLGYEASLVHSQIRILDHCVAAKARELTPEGFLERFNPMFPQNKEILAPYTVTLPSVAAGLSRLLLINNSPQKGVLHQASVRPDSKNQRIINSLMLATSGEKVGEEHLDIFLNSDDIANPNEKIYVYDPSDYTDHCCSLEEANRLADAVDELYFGSKKK